MFKSRAVPLAKTLASKPFPAQQVVARRGYASAGGGSPSNLPLYLGLAGLAGLSGYVYLDRTSGSAKAAISANKNEYLDRGKDLAQNAKDSLQAKTAAISANTNEYVDRGKDAIKGQAQAGAAALSANANEYASEAKDKVKDVKDNVVGPFDEEKKAIGKPDSTMALIKNSWVDFKLEKVEGYNHNSKIYTFSFPDEDSIAGGTVASALLVKASEADTLLDDKGKPVIRPYTPISQNDAKGSLRLLVKEYPTGKMSKHIANMKPGETLSFKGPIPKYTYQPNEFAHGFAIGGGSGITPMYQMITHSLGLEGDKTKWTLIFANVTEKDILLREEWDRLAKQHPDRFKAVYTLDNPPFFWRGEKGFVTKDMVAKYLPKDEQEKAATKFFVCGPPGQYVALCGPKDGMKQGEIKGALGEMGYGNDNVFKF